MANKIIGKTSGNIAEVDVNSNLRTSPSLVPATMGGILLFGRVDDGTISGVPDINPVECDDYYRLNIGQDIMLDTETFNYTAQNTGKHAYLTTTMTQAWTVGAVQTNSGSITTLNTGITGGTYAMFPLLGCSILSCEFQCAFSQAPATNTTIDIGFFLRGA